MSKRSEILAYIKASLDQAELFNGPVFTSQEQAYTLEEIPCALVLIPLERQDVLTESAPRTIKKVAEVTIQLIAEHEAGAEKELHDVFSDIERLILSDDTLGDTVSRVMPDSLEFSSAMQGERPILSGKLKLQIHYFESMERSDPTSELNVVPELTEGKSYGND